MVKLSRQEMNGRRLAVLDFAQEHDLVINPAKGFEATLQGCVDFGFCPCDPTKSRLQCPCDEALSDIEENGHCLCRMFWKDYETFKLMYRDENEG